MHVVLGTGPLGKSVIKELQKREEPLRIVNSSGKLSWTEKLPVSGTDLMNLDQAIAAVKGATYIYQCAQPQYHQWAEKFERLQENIIAAATATGAKLIVAENLYMYGDVNKVRHEGLPYVEHTKKGRVRSRLAKRLLELHHRGDLQVVVGRGSDFFGPGVKDSSVGERLFLPLVRGKAASVFGDPGRKHTYTYVEDFGRSLVLLGQAEDAYGEAWHVPNAETVSLQAFVQKAARIAGVEANLKPMGKWMLRMGGLFVPAAKESIEMMYQFEKDFVVSSQKFTNRFGQQATPLEQSLAATVEWYQAQR